MFIFLRFAFLFFLGMNYKQVEESAERLRELSGLAARLRSQRAMVEPAEPVSVTEPPSTLEELQRENDHLRKKYQKALVLLSKYRALCGAPVHPQLPNPPSVPSDTPPGPRRSLLSRYLEVHSLKSGEEDMFGLAESMNSAGGGFGCHKGEEPERIEEISNLLKSIQRPVLPIARRG